MRPCVLSYKALLTRSWQEISSLPSIKGSVHMIGRGRIDSTSCVASTWQQQEGYEA